jgi:alpha-L-fucosidase 2
VGGGQCYEHRHLSHLYPVFPGQEIVKAENPDLFPAFETAVKKRLLGAQSGWSLAHMACIYARLDDGERALECLELLSRSCLLDNFYTLHNDWRNMGICLTVPNAPIQMDANMGVVNALQEMVLYVSPRLIKLLPACPQKWPKGQVSNFRFCTGKISFSWNVATGVFTAELQADRSTDLQIILPPQFQSYTWQGQGEGVQIATFENDNRRIRAIITPAGRIEISGSR